jgi:hypothetical protein
MARLDRAVSDTAHLHQTMNWPMALGFRLRSPSGYMGG